MGELPGVSFRDGSGPVSSGGYVGQCASLYAPNTSEHGLPSRTYAHGFHVTNNTGLHGVDFGKAVFLATLGRPPVCSANPRRRTVFFWSNPPKVVQVVVGFVSVYVVNLHGPWACSKKGATHEPVYGISPWAIKHYADISGVHHNPVYGLPANAPYGTSVRHFVSLLEANNGFPDFVFRIHSEIIPARRITCPH